MMFTSEYQLSSEEDPFGKLTCGRLFYATIYNHYGELVRDFVPCIRNSDGAVGMFDQVEQIFYENKGTGEFIAGPSLEEDQSDKPIVSALDTGEFTRVVYISANGTQYIDTGFADRAGTTIEYAAIWEMNSLGYYDGYMVGACAEGSPYGENAAYYQGRYNRWRLEYGGRSIEYYDLPFTVGQKYEVRFRTVSGDVWVEVDGEKIMGSENWQNYSASHIMIFSSDYQLYNDSNVFGGNTSGRVYYARIYNHYGELVRDMVPCVRNSDGAAGMFDQVEQKFYGNDGTGYFTAGPEA